VLYYGKYAIVLVNQITHICYIKICSENIIDKTEFAKIVGLKLRSIRLENKKTIESTAFDAEMDYTQLSRIELGKINTSFFQIYKISKSLKVHMVDIVNELP
jgi:hypothetical protein